MKLLAADPPMRPLKEVEAVAQVGAGKDAQEATELLIDKVGGIL